MADQPADIPSLDDAGENSGIHDHMGLAARRVQLLTVDNS